MYKYDRYDQAMVDARVAEFRDQAQRRLEGKLSEDQFKPLRLMNGLYLQLHAYMLRVAIPYGTLNSTQMHALADIADKYDRGYGHFTTRQNIQYNWIKLEDAGDILADLAKVEMHAIQTSGNCIRNISSDHFAGAAQDELVDPRPYAELLRQWSSFHPEFMYLPRKFKIAVIASDTDRAAMRLHDIGIQIVERGGEIGASFYVGGGMGRTPMIAPNIREFVPLDQLITYSEACLRVYNRYGRRDNKYKARIKILVHELGAEEYTRQVEEEFAHLLEQGIEPPIAELERIKPYFADPAFEDGVKTVDRSDPDFALWIDRNTHRHKHDSYVSAVISLKPVGGIPGDASAEQMHLMADLAKEYSFDELRVMHTQNIVLPHVKIADLHALWTKLDAADLGTPNLDQIGDIIACPGLDYCSLANARSIPLAQKISERFAESGKQDKLGELKLKISGCINACGHHHAGHIGILGVDKKGVENYQLSLGGSEAEDTALGKITGRGFDEEGVINAVETVTDVYLAQKEDGERFLDTYNRIGMAPFKEALYD
ncbi:nitrite/sulfite reductase [Pontixanthobacter aestiaquae]|uniref:Nitrite/sulfite reductase n=1 Tax=Pontixanthobacter aestiaquae TaxID=1509367 RepID=A0A844Z6X7_9SPHN|nr:nitrite/sulfite reductase [Pontixanthobacter aestiaquae]MDN3646001.1 nitrite/sulfite reductase [Pontixanthobacter aestiaquae]MXO83006.1 nitrite/sulfite reductase [Pontixanthobacter aestiaquae]